MASFSLLFFIIPLVDVVSILEQEEEVADKIYITPPSGELDGDAGEEDRGSYVNNLGRKRLQADSIVILSNGKTIGEEDQEDNGNDTEPSQNHVSQKDRLQYKRTKKVVLLGGHIKEWQEHPLVVDIHAEDSPAKVCEFFFQ